MGAIQGLLSKDVLSPMLGSDYDDGYQDGLAGRLFHARHDKPSERYRKGWIRGYREFFCSRRPELCRGGLQPAIPV
jgi:hypothetical protein